MKMNQNKRYLSGVREKANMVEMADLLHDFGVPLVVVGCKADSLVVKDLAQLKKNDEAQREIRNICMKGIAVCTLLTSVVALNMCLQLGPV